MKYTTILLHRIAYYYTDYDGEMNTSDMEHIAYSITEGIGEGELCTCDPENDDITHNGWWSINEIEWL